MILEDYIHQSLEDLPEFKITVEETTTFKLCTLIKVKDTPSNVLKREVEFFHIDDKHEFIYAQVETLEEFLLKRVEILEQRVAKLEQLQRVNMSGNCF